MAKIKAIIKRPDEKVGHMTWISDTLENLQRTVGGYIETVTFGDMVIICDEEGRLKKKEPNCTIGNVSFVGTIIAVGQDGDEFADVPIDMTGWKFLIK
ncbi:MAG: DUF3846 domain-containing protein [Lachnospiraceae bacterium]|nr:DUF3846 domain-containing protein [Lachnospiraceae bacterium]